MPSVEVLPFTDADLNQAAGLLAARHERHRVAFPALDPVYENADSARVEITALWEQDDASGGVVVRDGRVTAFMVGIRKNDAIWGPNVWIETAGHAAASAEDVRDLYAFLAEQWVAAGRTSHTVVVPATEFDLVDAWFRLGFGHQHVHAIRDTASLSGHTPPPKGVVVRPAERADIDALAELEIALPTHQWLSPVFARHPLPTVAEARAEWEEDWGKGDLSPMVAELDGIVVGSAIACAIDVSSMHQGIARPPGAGFLGFAAVKAEARGRGVGRALGEAVLEWTRAAGHASVVTDWRMTNLLSSRVWPRLGFMPTFFRLHRTIA